MSFADTLNDKHFIGNFNNTIYRRRYLLALAVMKENTEKQVVNLKILL